MGIQQHPRPIRGRALPAVAALAAVGLLTSVAAAQAASGTTNLVAAANGGRVVHVTSEAPEPAWAATNLIDGKTVNYVLDRTGVPTGVEEPPAGSKGWSSANASFPQEIVFAFAGDETKLINKVVIDPRTYDPPAIGRWARDVEVLVSQTAPDGVYQSVGGPWRLLRVPKPQTFEFIPIEARYVKLRVLSNWGSDRCVELGEFEVYEAIVSGDDWGALINRFERTISDLEHFRQVSAERLEGTALPGTEPGASGPSGTSGETSLVSAAAGGRIVYFTSQDNDTTWAAQNLIDGLAVNFTSGENPQDVKIEPPPGGANGWSSSTAAMPQEIIFAFAGDESKLINRVRLDPRTIDPPIIGRWARDVEVLVSATTPDGKYVPVGGPWRLLRIPRPQTFEFEPIEARYVKLRILSNWGSDRCVELGEFEVFEARVGTNELDEIIGRLRQTLQDLMRLRSAPAAEPPAEAGG
jgi:hypothetical protein